MMKRIYGALITLVGIGSIIGFLFGEEAANGFVKLLGVIVSVAINFVNDILTIVSLS